MHPETTWQTVQRLKLELALGVAIGAAILLTAKYLAVIFLIFWLLAGGQ